MTARKSFFQRSNQHSLTHSYEKEAADGLDYLGSQEEIELELKNLEKKIGIQESKSWEISWGWMAASIVFLAGLSLFWFQPKTILEKNQIAQKKPLHSPVKKLAVMDSSPNSPKANDLVEREIISYKLPPIIEKEISEPFSTNLNIPVEDAKVSLEEKGMASNHQPTTFRAEADDQDKNLVVSDLAAPMAASIPKKIGSNSWESKLINSGIWDGKESLFSTKIAATLINGQLKLKRTNRFSENKWNSLDSLIQLNYSDNDLRKGYLDLILPLR